MPEIRHTQTNGNPEIKSATIHIPDDADLGTGTFTTIFVPEAFKGKSVNSTMLNNEVLFEITLTVNSNGAVVAGLGRPDEPHPSDQIIFELPSGIQYADKHEIRVSFIHWNVTGIFLDGTLLSNKS